MIKILKILTLWKYYFVENLILLLHATGGKDVDSSCDNIRLSLAPTPRNVGLQHSGQPEGASEIHGPLVPYVCQDLYLHQQVGTLIQTGFI